MADSIVKLRVESSEYDAKVKRAAQGLLQMEDAARKSGRSLETLSKEEKDFVSSLGRMQTASKDVRGRINELGKAFTDLSAQYNRLTAEEKKGDYGKALNKSLGELRDRVISAKGELSSINAELGNNGSMLEQLAQKYTGMGVGSLTKFSVASAGVGAAMKTVKDAFFQSESNIDEWGRTVEGAKGAYDVFLQSINNGNWSSFFSNLSTAVQGARDLYDALDRLGSIKSNNDAAIAIVQQQIAQLRLLKQQGQNVDDQLKAATQNLAKLQRQAVDAGKTAGTMQMRNTIRNSVNTTLGRANGINDKTLDLAINRVLTGGQASMDAYKRNYETLKRRGTRATREEQYISSTGQTQTRTVGGGFDINLLTKEQQRQYAIAKAITERETELQKGIATYAQAVREGTSNAREEFKGNRYALQGSTGGKGGGSSAQPKAVEMPAEGSIAYYQKLAQEAQKQINEAATDGARDAALALYNEYSRKIKQLKEDADARASIASGTAGVAINTADANFGDALKVPQKLGKIEGLKNLKTAGQQTAEAWTQAANAIGSIGSALAGIEDPAVKVMGTVAQAIASVALAGAQAMAAKDTTASGWAWIGAAASITATMISTIAAIKSATAGSFAEGGVIGGSSYYGDKLYARVNSGETILNQKQARTALDMMDSGGVRLDASNLKLVASVSGEKLRFAINANGRRTGRGEMAYARG